MKIISIDVGMKNLAYCLLDYSSNEYTINKWDVIDLCENKKYSCMGKLKNGTNRSVWEVDLYETFAPSAQISADKLTINCLDNTVYFVDHSAMKNELATWQWSFPGGNPSSSNLQNPVVTYEDPGTYDVSLIIENAYGIDNQTIPELITFTNDPIVMEGFDCDGNCQENFSNMTLIAEDSYGDGWNGNTFKILIDGQVLSQYTLSQGYYEEINLCIPNESYCVEIIVQEGGWPEEVSWELIQNGETILYGNSPYNIDLYNNCPIFGCTNQDAINFDPNADTDDGSCCLGSFYTILMEDSYGDGWNENTLIIADQELELEEGSEEEVIICLPINEECFNISCGGGDWQSEVSFTIYNMSGDIIISGGAPFNDCFLEGCMDEMACNFNINATIENGSCQYPEEGSDCENTYIYEENIYSNKLIKKCDILGRNVNEKSKDQLLFYIYKDGTVKKKKKIIY